jgi:hypothetical protein
MPDFGAPVADQVTPPNPNQSIQTLSGILGLANAQQNLQIGQQKLQVGQGEAQQAQQQMAERQLLQTTMQTGKDPDGNPIKGPDGEVNPVALAGFANKYLPLTGQGVTQSIIKTQSDRLALNDSVRALGQNYRNDLSGIVRSGVGTQDPSVVSAGLDAYVKQNPAAAAAAGPAQSLLQHLSPAMPQQQRDMALQHLAMQFQPANTTAQEQAPVTTQITGPGGGSQTVQVNPYSAVPQGATGPEVAQGLGPAEAAQRVQVFQNGQPGTVPLGSITPGAPGYNDGTSPFGSGRYGSQPGATPGFAATGAPIGTGTDVEWMKKDYQQVQADAGSAQQRIGLYNNVQQLSRQALTGPQDRLSYANSLLALVGVPKAQDLNDAQAALNKNASMIQQAFGGDTDMARSVVQHFTPGTAMPDKVNQEISDYGKAYGQMQQFAQKYLQGPSNGTDPGAYKAAKADLSLVADPRVWEFQNKPPADRVDMLRTMTPQQRAQFGETYKRAAALGAFQ